MEAGDLPALEVGAVGRAQVLHHPPRVSQLDLGVPPGDRWVVDEDVGALVATDEDGGLLEVVRLHDAPTQEERQLRHRIPPFACDLCGRRRRCGFLTTQCPVNPARSRSAVLGRIRVGGPRPARGPGADPNGARRTGPRAGSPARSRWTRRHRPRSRTHEILSEVTDVGSSRLNTNVRLARPRSRRCAVAQRRSGTRSLMDRARNCLGAVEQSHR